MDEDKSIRELIADRIKADNPTFIVKPFSAEKPVVEKINVFVTQESISNTAPTNLAITHEMKVFLMIPGSQSEPNESKLEAVLDDVLMSIAQLNFTQWQTATRGTLFDNFMGYEITLEARTENIYKRHTA